MTFVRIHWRRPRFRYSYFLLFVFLVTGIVVIRNYHSFGSGDASRSLRHAPFDEDFVYVDAHQRDSDVGLLAQGSPDARGAPLGETKKYDGPFPDSEVKEGVQAERVDYVNYTQVKVDAARTGLGEQGVSATLPPGMEKLRDQSYWSNGFNGLLSDNIALDRALSDIRHPKCATYRYYKNLPTVSVVIPFFEEHLSALQRTVVSVVNRSPSHLLKEIILVDDGSTTRPDLNRPLEDWLQTHAPMARVLRLQERMGLIMARQFGARDATADVIVVLDSHCEVMVNWLPPMLHLIVEDYRTAVCPLIDIIAWEDFAYRKQDDGARGAFDWHFYYKRIPLPSQQEKLLPQPFENPVMNGGLFAISRKFFWELGGYDTGIEIWGGEQYDLSFKIWLCGGRMLDVPCSRVGHVFRGHPTNRPAAKKKNFIEKNYKRVALVWMDEYIEALYRKKPELRKIDAGDISGELAIKERLHCKPFKWFLETIAYDLVSVYPPFEPDDFANGTIKSLHNNLCLDTAGRNTGEVILHPCHGGGNQRFAWCFRHTIRIPGEQFCLESHSSAGRSAVLFNCHNHNPPSKQKWIYNPQKKMLSDESKRMCLEAVDSKAVLEICDDNRSSQRWEFQRVNYNRIQSEFAGIW